jgi:CubicO group peptidase (beta-lactamase class C family)
MSVKKLSLIVIGFLFITSCHVGRFIIWNFADVGDAKKFLNRPISHGTEVFTFCKKEGPAWEPKIEVGTAGKEYKSMDDFLLESETVALLVIRNDTILFERYCYYRDSTTVHPSFSVSKSFVSALVGIAINEGAIGSVNDPINKYLPELKNPGMEKVTIDDLLQMRTGFKYNEGYFNPFGNVAKYYYGLNIPKYITQLEAGEEPGGKFHYVSVASQLLGMIVERATGKKLEQYLQEKIWVPLGMESDATWSIDSKKSGTVKAFCCLNATARDFAKFGRLYLNKGNWNGVQIVPEVWVARSITPYTKGQNFYSTQWWLLGEGRFAAVGFLGQYIAVDPATKTIFVRLGKKEGNTPWESLFKDIVTHQL